MGPKGTLWLDWVMWANKCDQTGKVHVCTDTLYLLNREPWITDMPNMVCILSDIIFVIVHCVLSFSFPSSNNVMHIVHLLLIFFFSDPVCISSRVYTVVSQVSTHGHLNITHNFGPHGRLPGIKIPYVCIEAATVAPWNAVHGCLPRTLR